jgi:HSP20 family protein
MFDFDWPDAGWLRVEEFTEGDYLVVRVELPGIDPEKDVEITVTDDLLHIRGERQDKSETTKDGFRSEFHYGSFDRTIPVPPGFDPAAVEATYADGILTVKVPVQAEKPPTHRVIPVKTTG